MRVEWPHKTVVDEIDRVMGITQGKSPMPYKRLHLCTTLYDFVLRELELPEVDPPRQVEFLEGFLKAVTERYSSDPSIAASRELLGFTRHNDDEIQRILSEEDHSLNAHDVKLGYRSKLVRLYLAGRELKPPVKSRTTKKGQREVLAEAVTASIYDLFDRHWNEARDIVIRLCSHSSLRPLVPPAPQAFRTTVEDMLALGYDPNVAALVAALRSMIKDKFGSLSSFHHVYEQRSNISLNYSELSGQLDSRQFNRGPEKHVADAVVDLCDPTQHEQIDQLWDSVHREDFQAGSEPTSEEFEASDEDRTVFLAADIVFRANMFVNKIQPRSKIPDDLLRGALPEDSTGWFGPIKDLLESCPATTSIQVLTSFEPALVRIVDFEDFVAVLLCDRILARGDSRERKWLVQETRRILKKNIPTEVRQLERVWRRLLGICRQRIGSTQPDLLRGFLDAAISATKDNANYMYAVFDFLLSMSSNEADISDRIFNLLEEFERSLGDETSPAKLVKLKYLIGKRHPVNESFEPQLLHVVDTAALNYTFDASRFVLTNRDVRVLGCPVDPEENARLPYIFSDTQRHADVRPMARNLSSHLATIIGQCSDAQKQVDHCWDIPTVVEWLALAGCTTQPFPWGSKHPTPNQANLNFDRDRNFDRSRRRVHPVGSYPKGRSPAGVEDCCGNVYELVRIGMGNKLPVDFCLAGGCYLTHPKSCQIFRPFLEDHHQRDNIGIRMVHYNRGIEEARQLALYRYLAETNLLQTLARVGRVSRGGPRR